jgi:hypothetical protein
MQRYWQGRKPSFPPQDLGTLRWRLAHWRKIGAEVAADELRAKVCRRMGDSSACMKRQEQRFGG